MKEKFDVTGMTCSACSSRVEKCVAKLEGVQSVSVNLLTNSMQVDFDDSRLSPGGIAKAVEKAGYGASVHEEKAGSDRKAEKAEAGENPVEAQLKNMKFRRGSLLDF